jgi:short-subunit dehydrogenase
MQLSGSNALLTGAGGGLGGYIARALAGEGVNLALSDVSSEAIEPVAEQARALGAGVEAIPADLTELEGPEALAASAAERLGPIERHSRDEVDAIARVNLFAPIELTRRLLPGMLARGRGQVVNMASVAGRAAAPLGSTYCATKSGLIAFTHSMRAEYPRGPVGFSAICPGFVERAGMYGRVEGKARKPVTGTIAPERVGNAVVKAIRDDVPEQLINARPIRPLALLGVLAPGFAARLNARVLRRSAESIARANGRL